MAERVEAAYRRGDPIDKRVQLMKAWADYCAQPQAEASVTSIGSQRKAAKRPASYMDLNPYCFKSIIHP